MVDEHSVLPSLTCLKNTKCFFFFSYSLSSSLSFHLLVFLTVIAQFALLYYIPFCVCFFTTLLKYLFYYSISFTQLHHININVKVSFVFFYYFSSLLQKLILIFCSIILLLCLFCCFHIGIILFMAVFYLSECERKSLRRFSR